MEGGRVFHARPRRQHAPVAAPEGDHRAAVAVRGGAPGQAVHGPRLHLVDKLHVVRERLLVREQVQAGHAATVVVVRVVVGGGAGATFAIETVLREDEGGAVRPGGRAQRASGEDESISFGGWV